MRLVTLWFWRIFLQCSCWEVWCHCTPLDVKHAYFFPLGSSYHFSLSFMCWNFVMIFHGVGIFHLLCWIVSGLFQCEEISSERSLIIFLVISFSFYFFCYSFMEVQFAIWWDSWVKPWVSCLFHLFFLISLLLVLFSSSPNFLFQPI